MRNLERFKKTDMEKVNEEEANKRETNKEKRNSLSPEEKNEIRKLQEKGISDTEISKILGISRYVIRGQRPEFKERQRKYMEEYRQRLEVKERQRKYGKEYRQRPEVKQHKKECRQGLKNKERMRRNPGLEEFLDYLSGTKDTLNLDNIYVRILKNFVDSEGKERNPKCRSIRHYVKEEIVMDQLTKIKIKREEETGMAISKKESSDLRARLKREIKDLRIQRELRELRKHSLLIYEDNRYRLTQKGKDLIKKKISQFATDVFSVR